MWMKRQLLNTIGSKAAGIFADHGGGAALDPRRKTNRIQRHSLRRAVFKGQNFRRESVAIAGTIYL